MSANKGRRSRKGRDDEAKRVQVDHAEKLKRRRTEGHRISERTWQNAPVPFIFKVICTTFDKMLGSHQLNWTSDKARQSKMITLIKACFEPSAANTEVMIMAHSTASRRTGNPRSLLLCKCKEAAWMQNMLRLGAFSTNSASSTGAGHFLRKSYKTS